MSVYILKVLTSSINGGVSGDGASIDMYAFTSEKEVRIAASEMRNTDSPWFTAVIKDVHDYNHGHLLDQGNLNQRYIPASVGYTLQRGAYKDTKWRIICHRAEAEAEASKINKQATCWASDYANVKQIVGDLWAVDVTRPFTD